EWRAAGADAALLRDALALQHQVLDVAQVRVDAGLSPQLDVDRARAEVASVEAEAARAAARIPLAFAALQVLAGARPTPRAAHAGDPRASLAAGDEGVEAAAAVPLLRGDLPVTRPIDLLRMRPDLRAAEHALLGAAANIGVARRALLPSLRLPGTIGLISGEGVLDVLSASIAAVIDQAIYDGGLRAAGVD